MLISFRSVIKHGHYRQFLFLVGQFKKKNSSLKPFCQINWNLVRSTYESFCIKFHQNRMTGERHRLRVTYICDIIQKFCWIDLNWQWKPFALHCDVKIVFKSANIIVLFKTSVVFCISFIYYHKFLSYIQS